MNQSARQMLETRRLYKWEAAALKVTDYVGQPRTESFLQNLAAEVWAKHGRERVSVPVVNVVDGATWSDCQGYTRITLATAKNTRKNIPHNTIDVLLHELTHAIGFRTHGYGFVRKYAQLLVEYGKCDPCELRMSMEMFNLPLRKT